MFHNFDDSWPSPYVVGKTKYYNNSVFFSVEKDFLAQAGDPTNTGKVREALFLTLAVAIITLFARGESPYMDNYMAIKPGEDFLCLFLL